MSPKVTASQRCGVGSNRRRTSSPQDNEPVQFTPDLIRGRRDVASLPEHGEAWVLSTRLGPISMR